MENASEWVAAHVMFGSISIGLALILLLAQDRTRTNLAMGSLFVVLGIVMPISVALALEVYPYDLELATRITGLLEATVVAGSSVYFSGLVATAQVTKRAERLIFWTIRCGFVLAAWHALATLLFPARRLQDFSLALFQQAEPYDRVGFWLFASTWILTAVSFGFAYFVLFRQQIDPAERDRALTTLISGPILVFTIFLPIGPATMVALVSMLAAMLSQVRYNVLRGREGAFLSRFLSDQVSDLVRTDGLAEVMKPHEVDLTVVACDLRGFTAYAEAVPSQAVIDLLNEYYEAVGSAVAEHAGTIKDYAGDGVLVLIGAPLPRRDHAVVGLDLARRLHEVVRPVLLHWSTKPHPLGLGVGVASGRVTVGAVGSMSRMEYTAVGTPVNLAARLCSVSTDGQTLVSQHTAELVGIERLDEHAAIQIKGLSGDHRVYAPREPPELSSAPGSTTS